MSTAPISARTALPARSRSPGCRTRKAASWVITSERTISAPSMATSAECDCSDDVWPVVIWPASRSQDAGYHLPMGMRSSDQALKRLRASRNVFGADAEREKRALLLQLRAITLGTHAQVNALNEDLLFLCAFPGVASTRRLARRTLGEIA